MAQSGSFNLLFDRTAGGGQESSSDDTSDEDSPPQGVDFSLLACLNLSSAEKREASSGSVEEKPDKGDRETTQGRQGNDKAKTGKKKVKAKATEAPPEQVPVKQAEEDFRIELINIFKAFQKSKAQEYLFPRDLSNLQRKFIHAESKKYGFKSKSTGKGEKRFLRLTKYRTLTTKDSIEKKFELHESSLQVLRDLLQKHPPSAQELFNSAELQMTSEYNHHKKHASRKGKRKGGGNRAELWSTEKVAAELEALRLRRKERRCAAVQRTREALPISARKREILDLVRNNQIVLLAGETGCGKTTQVPQIIAESCWEEGKPCRVVCTQPRRISAISVAERIASERGESIGQSVGYSIRLEKKGTPQSSIVLCTNGVLLRQLVQKGHFRADDARNQSEGLVEGLTHLVVDEIHERDRFVDFILIILRDILPLNPNMKVVLMSATLQIDLLSSYFGNCPTIQVEGFMYPVEQFYLEDVLKFVGFAKAGGVSSEMAAPPELERAMMNAFIAGTDEAFEELMGEALAGAVEGATGSAPYVNAVHNTTGATALMVAAGKGRTDVCTVLIEHGADLGLASKDGKGKAKDWACKFGHHDLAEMLISREEESRKDRNKQSETASMLNQYQLSIDQDEVDLKIIVELISFLEEDQSFDVENSKGAILVFLPGWDEIIRLKNLLESSSLGDGLAVLPLHSMVPVPEQRKVFQKPPKGQRKVVLATNIAETAITIDDIVYVINSGRHKEKSYDPYTGVSTLLSSWTSRASEKQRKGRAGRCQPGVCFHIYSTSRSDSLLDFQIPELKRSPLEEVCLQIKVMESNGLPVTQTTNSGDSTVKTFLSRALEPPVPEAVQQALELLETIGALLPGEKLTVLGKHLASLPLPPQLGKLLLYSIIFGCLDNVLTSACFSAYRLPWVFPVQQAARTEADKARNAFAVGVPSSDHLAAVAAFNGWRKAEKKGYAWKFCNQNFLSQGTLRMVDGMRTQIAGGLRDAKVIRNLGESSTFCVTGLERSVLGCGYYPQIGYMKRLELERVAKQKDKMKPSLMTKRGEVVRIHKQSIVSNRSTSKRTEEEADPIFAFGEVTRNDRGLNVSAVTELPFLALCVVAMDLQVEQAPVGEDGCINSILIIDGWLKYLVPQMYATYIKCLRGRLSETFAFLIERSWDADMPARLTDSMAALREVMIIEAGGDQARREFTGQYQGIGRKSGGRGRSGRWWWKG